jgi:hypothetical protein
LPSCTKSSSVGLAILAGSVTVTDVPFGPLDVGLFLSRGTSNQSVSLPLSCLSTTQPERRESALRDLIRKRQRPIALFIDDAHDLHSKTLIGLKRLIEVVRDSGGHTFGSTGRSSKAEERSASAVMEEIGSRATIFELEGLGREKRTYIKWLLTQSTAPKTKIQGIITEDALATLRAGADVFELFSNNVSPLSFNVSRRASLFSVNLGPELAMFLSQSVYVLRPLHLGRLARLRLSLKS